MTNQHKHFASRLRCGRVVPVVGGPRGTPVLLLSDECEATLSVEALVQVTCTPLGEQSFSLGHRSQAGAALSVGDRATAGTYNWSAFLWLCMLRAREVVVRLLK